MDQAPRNRSHRVSAAAHDVVGKPLAGHRTALGLLLLAFTLSISDRMILSILFPDIKAEFGLSDAQLGVLGGLSFALFYATMGLPIARLADQFSRKWIIVVSLLVFSIMTALGGLAMGFATLLIFRIGVGVGEAGVGPASQSILADYFPPKRRGFAMAILLLGGSFGMILGFVGGGIIAEAHGWRAALISIGLPGVLLAFLMAKFLREPPRGTFDSETPAPPPAIRTTAIAMWNNPAMRHLVAGLVVAGMISYGITQWLPTFFIRTHELSQSQTGLLMAGVFGILGAIGAVVAGKVFDRLSIRGFQYGMWMMAAVPFFTMPFFILGLLADDLKTAMLFFIIPGFAANLYFGPALAMIQTLSPVNMRAVSSALQSFFTNLIGMGLGPVIVGAFSDLLGPRYGDKSLSVALAYFSLIGLWGSLHFWLCGRALAKQQAAKSVQSAASV